MYNLKNFRQEIVIPKLHYCIDHKREILLFGSCFSNEMLGWFQKGGFGASTYYGTVYNPITLSNNINRSIDNNVFGNNDLVSQNDIFFSWHHSGRYFSTTKKEDLLNHINQEQNQLSRMLNKKPFIIVTFGSSIVYELNSSIGIVANCHKQPSQLFNKKRLAINEIVDSWNSLINKIDADFIFTVSPVRHKRDGMSINNKSKAILLLSVEQICQSNPEKASYFPSYELLLDELRDYRFYSKDLAHPSTEATEFIWNKFQDFSMDQNTINISNKVMSIHKDLDHKSLYGNTKEYKLFKNKLKQKVIDISKQTPLYNWENRFKMIDK